jgi:hypothetical protein
MVIDMDMDMEMDISKGRSGSCELEMRSRSVIGIYLVMNATCYDLDWPNALHILHARHSP